MLNEFQLWIDFLIKSLDRLFNKKFWNGPKQAFITFVIYLCEVGLSILMIRKSEYQSTMKSAEDASFPTASNGQPRFKQK